MSWEELAKRGDTGIGVDIEEMDITDPDSVGRVIRESGCFGCDPLCSLTAVDKAEECVDLAARSMLMGQRTLRKVCEELDLPMMYFFDGLCIRRKRNASVRA